MAHKIGDRAKETTSTTGTGSFTTTGAVSEFVALSSVMTADGDTSWYAAQSGGEWEVGLCTRSSSTSYARTTILASSNSGSAVNFTTAPIIFLTIPSSALVPLGGPAFCAYRGTDQTGVTSSTYTKVQLASEEFDTNACFDSSTNYRFTPNIPGYYRFEWAVDVRGATLTEGFSRLYKNGSAFANGVWGYPASNVFSSVGARTLYMNGSSDYVELYGYGTGTSVKFAGSSVGTYLSGSLVRAA